LGPSKMLATKQISSCAKQLRFPTHGPALPARRTCQRQGRTRLAVMNFGTSDPMESVRVVSQIASTLTVGAVGLWLLHKELQLEQDRVESPFKEPCPSCGGSGYERCACTRWSDGDVGCSSCSRTGYTRCRSCGGGGTAVPIKVSIPKRDPMR